MLMSKSDRAAKLHYMANGFRVLSTGDHVVCAKSGVRIPIEELRYWDVATQQPFASAEIASEVLSAR